MRKKPVDLVVPSGQLLRVGDIIQGMISAFPSSVSKRLVTDYVEANRVFPAGTPYPGRFRTELTPYLREIMDNFSPRSNVQEFYWLKCSQIGATVMLENAIAYIIHEAPGPALYVSAKEDLLRKWVNKRFGPLIKSCNLEDRIYKQNVLRGGRASGNQMFSKEFPGGSLDIVSAQSESNLRMDSIRYLLMDELSSWPWSVSGLGDPVAIARARTANWGSRARIAGVSTPGVEGECRMLPLYREGDQRRWFVPCPLCSGRFVLRFQSEPEDFYEGVADAPLHYDAPANVLDVSSIHVVCPHCGGKVPEAARYDMIQKGEWVSTGKPTRKGVRSYQIGRLYSLMDSWARLAQLELDSQDDPLIQQTFMNHSAGWPYRETTQKPDISRIYNLRQGYKSGEIPTDKVLFLTAAVDVQHGKKNDPSKPQRLEMEILGHGYGYSTWSLGYHVFPGSVFDPYDGAFGDMYDWIQSGGMQCRRTDGFVMQPRMVAIDSGDGNTETAVFDFCSRFNGFIPVKGVADLKKTVAGQRTDIALDERGPRDRDRWRIHTKYDQQYLSIFTVWFKSMLFRSLRLTGQTTPGGELRPRQCYFPADYPDRYFDGLVAEEQRADGSFWRPESRSNEPLDLRVYNMAIAEYFLYCLLMSERKAMIKIGYTRDQADKLQTRHVIDKMISQMKRKVVK